MNTYTININEEDLEILEKLRKDFKVIDKILITISKQEKRKKAKKLHKDKKLIQQFSGKLIESKEVVKEVPQKIKEVAEKFRVDLIKNQTPSEVLVKAHLKSLGYTYEFQKIFYITPHKFYIADFYLKDYNIVIEIDGGYHFEKEQRIKDGIRTSDLKKYGVISVLRITNGQCRNDERSRTLIKNKINGVLGNLKARKASITAKAKNNRKKK